MKKILALCLTLIMVISLVACTSGEDNTDDDRYDDDGSKSKENSIVGEWYNKDGKCLDIRSDGSWKLEDSYGTGTWKELDDDNYEFTDFYGDTQESEINKDDKGKYIDFGNYGDFYKGRYPAENDNADNENTNISDHDKEPETETNIIELNPFENLSFEVSGISPYCIIAVNNSNCNSDVQKYVTYKLDKDTYANGEVASITAVLSANTGKNEYSLSSTTMEYEVSNQPEYITSLDGVDLSMLNAEISDAIESEKDSVSDSESLFTMSAYDAGGTHIKSCDNILLGDVYFSSLKAHKNSIFNLGNDPYNCLSFTYAVEYTWVGYYLNWTDSGTGTLYLNVTAQNIVKYPDGTISWGSNSTEGYDFVYCHSQKGMDDCVSTTIMCNRENYNISKVDP